MSHNLVSPLRWIGTERQPQFFQLQTGDSVCSPGWLWWISSFPNGRNWRAKIWCPTRAIGPLPAFHEGPVRLPILSAGPGEQEAAFMVHCEDTVRYNATCVALFCSLTSLVALQNYFSTDYPPLSRLNYGWYCCHLQAWHVISWDMARKTAVSADHILKICAKKKHLQGLCRVLCPAYAPLSVQP